MNRLICIAAAAVIAAGCTATAYAQTAAPATNSGKSWGHHHEHHPEIHRAMTKLEHAKDDLREGAHDFGGHRAKALEHVDAALAELRQALEHDEREDHGGEHH